LLPRFGPTEYTFYLRTVQSPKLCFKYKNKAKLIPVLNELSTTLPHILDFSTSLGGGRSASCSGRFIPREKIPQYSLDRRLDGPKTGLDHVEKNKSWPYRGSKSDFSVVQAVTSRYADCAIPTSLPPKKNDKSCSKCQ
jgi:hypothetical protein